MKKQTNIILAAAVALFSAMCLQAADTPTQARILKITGTDAQVQMPGGETRALQPGDGFMHFRVRILPA